MKYLKKIVAISTIALILIASSISTNAAGINGATAELNGTLAIGQTITITKAGEFPGEDEIASAKITKLDGSTDGTTLTAGGDNTDSDSSVLTIATIGLTDNTSYFITFTTVSGDVGSTTLRVGTPTNDTLTVSASVEPMLKFAMETSNRDFGVLSATSTGTVTTGIEIGTNAVGGITVSAQTTNGGLKSDSASHTINLTGNDALYAAEDYIFSTALGAADSASGATIAGATTTSMNTVNQTIPVYSSNKPQNFSTTNYDVDFTVSAKIAESTPAASDYKDVIIFTATANF